MVTMRARQYVLFRNIRHSSRVTTNRAPVNLSSPLRSSSRIQPNEYHGPFLSFLLLLLLLFLLNPSFGGGEGRDSKIAERRGLETRDDTIHGGRGNYLFRNGGGKYELRREGGWKSWKNPSARTTRGIIGPSVARSGRVRDCFDRAITVVDAFRWGKKEEEEEEKRGKSEGKKSAIPNNERGRVNVGREEGVAFFRGELIDSLVRSLDSALRPLLLPRPPSPSPYSSHGFPRSLAHSLARALK